MNICHDCLTEFVQDQQTFGNDPECIVRVGYTFTIVRPTDCNAYIHDHRIDPTPDILSPDG